MPILPEGSSLAEVLGFSRSISRSKTLLSARATVRAPVPARIISTKSRALKIPPAARKAPAKITGREKKVCSILRKPERFFKNVIFWIRSPTGCFICTYGLLSEKSLAQPCPALLCLSFKITVIFSNTPQISMRIRKAIPREAETGGWIQCRFRSPEPAFSNLSRDDGNI